MDAQALAGAWSNQSASLSHLAGHGSWAARPRALSSHHVWFDRRRAQWPPLTCCAIHPLRSLRLDDEMGRCEHDESDDGIGP